MAIRSWMSALALVGLAACGREDPAGAPNVLLITIDTLRADRLGFAGYSRPTSPALDALAAGALVFEDAQASAPWTLPALSSVMTGEVAATHGCTTYGSVLDDSFTTLAEHLLADGYDTACVVRHLFATSRHGLQQGFVHTDDSFAYPEVEPAKSVSSQVISDKGIRFLDQKKAARAEAPWLLWLHYFDPHEDYMEHQGISANFVSPGERAVGQVHGDLYDGEVRYTDQHVGRVLDRLREIGLAEDTLVVLLADHGEEFFEHGALGHGHSMHREVVRVPLVIRVPGALPGRAHETVRQIDLLPTVLELCALPPVVGLPGRSLVPALRGLPLPPEGALAELDNGSYRMDSWQDGRFKLIQSDKDGSARLFDLESDPLETSDVALQYPLELEGLRAGLARAKAAGRARARLSGVELSFTPGQQQDLDALGYGRGAGDGSVEPEQR